MKKRLNLYYLFLEEKEQTKMTKEKNAEVLRIIEAFFHAMKKTQPALPTDQKEE